jgi:hypothetical protein
MKKTLILTSVLIFLLTTFYGCATIFRGDSTKVRFNSDPQGARVFLNGHYQGRTPMKLHLKSSQSYSIEFRKEGFEPVVRQINSNVGAGWVILDVLVGMVPVVVDALTGSWYHLDQKNVNVILTSQQPWWPGYKNLEANLSASAHRFATIRAKGKIIWKRFMAKMALPVFLEMIRIRGFVFTRWSGIATRAKKKRRSLFYRDQRNKKKAQIMVDPSGLHGTIPTGGAGLWMVAQGNGFRLNSTDD